MVYASPYPGTQSVRRALGLLKAFSDARPERGLTDLARESGLNKSTTYRLLAALAHEGLVVRAGQSDGYRLGPEAIAIGARALRANDLRTAGRPVLEWLASSSGETATLEVLTGAQVMVLDEQPGESVLTATQYTGRRWDAHVVGTGKVLLAHLAPDELQGVLTGAPLTAYTERTITDRTALIAGLEAARTRGHATAVEELEVGFVDIGAPVRNHAGRVTCAVGLSGPGARLTPERMPDLSALVVEAAARISENLGYGR